MTGRESGLPPKCACCWGRHDYSAKECRERKDSIGTGTQAPAKPPASRLTASEVGEAGRYPDVPVDVLEPNRPLTIDERTETLLDEDDGDIAYICGCTFWREGGTPELDCSLKVTWCENHAPLRMWDEAGVSIV